MKTTITRFTKCVAFSGVIFCTPVELLAQQRDTAMQHMHTPADTAHAKEMSAHQSGMSNNDEMMPGPLGISMDRMGSGTTWIPDAVPLPSYHTMLNDWTVMLHGFVFGQLDKQGGRRGDTQAGSLNWAMLMASHQLAGGRFQARTMLSLDPLTVSNRGYPLLLQTGEAYKGVPLHDRQHPHDFLMEIGFLYERELSKSLGVSLADFTSLAGCHAHSVWRPYSGSFHTAREARGLFVQWT